MGTDRTLKTRVTRVRPYDGTILKNFLGGKRDVTPRFVYVDATEWTKKGEISFHDKVTLEQKSFSRFYIIDPLKGRSGR